MDYFALGFASFVTAVFVLSVVRYLKRRDKRNRDTSVISNIGGFKDNRGR